MIVDVNSIETIIRNILIEQSQLDGKFVRNALSLYSTPLDKSNENILDTLEQDDSLILFELRTRDDVLNISDQDEETEIISYYQAYQVHVIVYGDSSKTLSNKLIARLRTARLGDIFRANGLQCYGVTNPETISEYINEVMWTRCDFDIDISTELSITPILNDYYANDLTDLEVITN